MALTANDPVAHLLADHAAVTARLARVRDTLPALLGERPTVSAALTTLRAELAWLDSALDRHMEKEEAALFPPLQAAAGAAAAVVHEMLAEHDHVLLRQRLLRVALDRALTEHDHADADLATARADLGAALALAAAAPAAGETVAGAVDLAARRLLHVLRVHFRNEERHLFPLVPAALTADEQRRVAAQLATITARPADAAPYARPPRPNAAVPPARVTPPLALAEALATLRQSPRLVAAGWAVAVLAKQPGLIVSLVLLRAGARFQAARATGPTLAQVVAGALTVTHDGESHPLATGALLTLPAGAGYTVTASAEAALLLTVATERPRS